MQVTYKLTAEDWIVVYTRYTVDVFRRRFPMGPGTVVRGLLTAGAIVLLLPGSIAMLVIANAWLAPLVGSSKERFLLTLVVTAAYAELVILTCCVVGRFWRSSQRGPWLGLLFAKLRLERIAQRAARRQVRLAIEEGIIRLGWSYQLTADATGIMELAELEESGEMRRSETRVAWSIIEKIDPTGRYVLFSAGKLRYFLVPSAAFPNHAAFREFVESIRKLWSTPSPTGITAALPNCTAGGPEIQATPPKTM